MINLDTLQERLLGAICCDGPLESIKAEESPESLRSAFAHLDDVGLIRMSHDGAGKELGWVATRAGDCYPDVD